MAKRTKILKKVIIFTDAVGVIERCKDRVALMLNETTRHGGGWRNTYTLAICRNLMDASG